MLIMQQLPWSTSNEDLVELFQTIGKVERAEIQFEFNGRSKGSGVVEFDSADNAETAICKLKRDYWYDCSRKNTDLFSSTQPNSLGINTAVVLSA